METLHGPISSFSFVPKFVLTDLVSHILGREYNRHALRDYYNMEDAAAMSPDY
jgi:hypothetical protein